MRAIQTTHAFGAEIRRVRKERGLTQTELASLAGVGRPWLSELETGKRTVELGRALTVLAALDLAVTFTPAPRPAPGGVDLARLLGEDT